MPDDDLELEACWRDIRPRLRGGRSCKSRLLGQQFGRLRVIEAAGSDKHGASLWKCLCECGKEKIVARGALKSGRVKSCGCLLEEYKRSLKPHLGKKAARRRLLNLTEDQEHFNRQLRTGLDLLDEVVGEGLPPPVRRPRRR